MRQFIANFYQNNPQIFVDHFDMGKRQIIKLSENGKEFS